MAGGLHHHHHEIGGTKTPPPIRSAELAGSYAAPDCEQAAGAETPLSVAPAACSPFPSHAAPCGRCAGTPARRCCLALAARPDLWICEGLFDVIETQARGFNAVADGVAEGSKFQKLTAPMGGAA